MASELLRNYSWTKFEYIPMEGTDDWVEVARLGVGGYEWAELNAFYSSSARRYFWHGGSGCSCNSWDEQVSSAAEFENGDKIALLRAWESFAKEHGYAINTSEYLDGVSTIRSFKEGN